MEHEFTIEQREGPSLGLKSSPGYLASSNFVTNGHRFTCICRPKHESVRRYAKLGDLSFKILNDSRRNHLPECKYAKSEISSTSASIGFSYNGLRWVLSTAVDFSISFNTRSGGLSISPNITFRPIVDKHRAPVFQSLRLVTAVAYSDAPPDVILPLLELALNRIIRQYISRRSSPYEVDSQGETALHLWAEVRFLFRN